MRVLFLTPWYPTVDHIYAGVFVREHAKAVRALGHEVVVIHAAGPRKSGHRPWSIKSETDSTLTEGIPTYRVFHARLPYRTSYLSYVLSTVAAYNRIRLGGFRPDVIHSHTYVPGVPAIVLGAVFRRPVVITEQFTGFPRQSLSSTELVKARVAFHKAKRVLPVSEHLRDAIMSYGIHAQYEIVPNVVDTMVFFPDATANGCGQKKRLLFVGNLDHNHHKGFPTLIGALKLMREQRQDWRLEVVGGGPQRPAYERAVQGAGLSDAVVFHGPLPKSDVAEMMRAADVFVLPSRYDNLPCAVIEALASGLPVVSTRVGGIPEIVDQRSGVLVPPEEPAALAAALERVLSSLPEFDAKEIAASAGSRYGLRTVGEHLDAVYRSVVSESRRGAGSR